MISKNTIDAIFDATRVEEVIGDFVSLKKSGSNYKGLSPFSNEKTPSFMVSPAKQIWKDFSSGKGGNAISFLMEHEHFTYPEALRYLAKKYNIEIEETEQTDEDKQLVNEKESLFLVSEFAKKYFEEILWKTDEGQAVGLSYFKERGFSKNTIEKFGLGYSPDRWDAFTEEALSKGYNLDYLEKTGLTIVKEDKKFDRFKGRVMFPIQSLSGRVLGFGGRILGNDKKMAKYLNSPESDIYHKSKILYGIYHAKQAIAKEDNCILVEGYTDVIQMHQAGIENVVASSGTALTPDQIRLIQRLTQNVTVLFDGDAAGMRASLRGIDLILETGMNVRVCALPEGEDPDSLARKLPVSELQEFLQNEAVDFIRFKANLLMQETKNDPIEKANVIRDMVGSISKIPDRIQQEIYVQECARIMDISEEVLFSTLAQIGKKQLQEANKRHNQQQKSLEVVKSTEPSEVKKTQVNIKELLEQRIIEILLLYGNHEEYFEEEILIPNEEEEKAEQKTIRLKRKVIEQVYLNLHQDEMEFTNELFRDIYQHIIAFYQQHDYWSLESYLPTLSPEMSEVITSIVMDDEKYKLDNWEGKNIFVKAKTDTLSQYVTENIYTLRWYLINDYINQQKNDLIQKKQPEESTEILEEITEHTKTIKMIADKLGRVLSRF
ncbi:DNA primase [Avrilella dinanensis]|uniref:DNA primase n=1 Tax=Avrilella dinanensis TaxID=2008672 RepID=UPI002409DB52|nr:DNA primase [Avrilella dinanensis]